MITQAVVRADARGLWKAHFRRARLDASLPALTHVYSQLESASILGGNPAGAYSGRYSYWMARPRRVFEHRTGQDDPFARLGAALSAYGIGDLSSAGPDVHHPTHPCEQGPKGMFCGGWVGYFGYELGRYIETLAQTTIDDLETPLIRLCFYDRLIAYDHTNDAFWLVALELPQDTESASDKMDCLEQWAHACEHVQVGEYPAQPPRDVDRTAPRYNMTKQQYLSEVERIQRYIRDGEVYQVNFSRRFDCEYTARPIDLFAWQNRNNPSGYAAYIDAGDFQIVSASPEMFLTIGNGMIRTKPIKGTRPRLNEAEAHGRDVSTVNARHYAELMASEKERAELNMIIDLERNDLARVCVPGTRSVIQPRTVETYPTVFHAVATIGGTLRRGVGLEDVLRATFPGGSITGAPKIRAMEIIDETEPTARGVYTGSIGAVGVDANVCLNIAIRTVIITGHKAYVQTGGGIVADSEPQAEWQETITKARALLAGIECVHASGAATAPKP